MSGEFIQTLHTGSAHWVCVSNIGCQPFDANLFDSLYQDVICQEVVDQTNDPLDGRLNSLNYAPVQQQNNGNDCGIFNIAFSCYLVNGKEPWQVTFDPFGAIGGQKLTDAEHTLKARLIRGT